MIVRPIENFTYPDGDDEATALLYCQSICRWVVGVWRRHGMMRPADASTWYHGGSWYAIGDEWEDGEAFLLPTHWTKLPDAPAGDMG